MKQDYLRDLKLKQKRNEDDNGIFAGTVSKKTKTNKRAGRKKKHNVWDVDIYKDSNIEAPAMEMTKDEWDEQNKLTGEDGGLAQIIAATNKVNQTQLEWNKSLLKFVANLFQLHSYITDAEF